MVSVWWMLLTVVYITERFLCTRHNWYCHSCSKHWTHECNCSRCLCNIHYDLFYQMTVFHFSNHVVVFDISQHCILSRTCCDFLLFESVDLYTKEHSWYNDRTFPSKTCKRFLDILWIRSNFSCIAMFWNIQLQHYIFSCMYHRKKKQAMPI